MSESINETTTIVDSSESFFKGKFWRCTKKVGAIVAEAVVVGAISGAAAFVVIKTLYGECPIDIG